MRETVTDYQSFKPAKIFYIYILFYIFWPARISKEDLLERAQQTAVTTQIKQRRWKWLALTWTPDRGKRKRDRHGDMEENNGE